MLYNKKCIEKSNLEPARQQFFPQIFPIERVSAAVQPSQQTAERQQTQAPIFSDTHPLFISKQKQQKSKDPIKSREHTHFINTSVNK
jgi:hypothetical protein